MGQSIWKILKISVRILPYIFVFISSLYLPKDSDLGWHLKYGEYFFQHHQVLRDNIFSTMMPNFHWANESWGTDLITYAVFNWGGFFGLTILAATTVTLTFFFFSKAAKLSVLEEAVFFPVLIYLESAINIVAFRGQQLSLLFIGLLFYLLSKYRSSPKVLLSVPVLFLIWFNIHGESILGLALFGLWVSFEIIKQFIQNYQKDKPKLFKEAKILVIILTLTIFATFINPFGAEIHLFTLSHFGNPMLQKISEYLPFFTFSKQWWNLAAVAFIVLAGVIYLAFKKKIISHLSILGIPIVLIILAFGVRRYAWPAYYLFLPVFHILGQIIESHYKKYAFIAACFVSLLSIWIVTGTKTPFNQFTKMSWNTYCQLQEVPCSAKSAEYLRDHSLSPNLFTLYDWGGWLIWNYPEIKPSVDGRMIAWKDEKGFSAASEFESLMNNSKNIDNSSYDVVYISPDRSPLFLELSSLISQNKWKLEYEDDFTIIISRIK